MDAPKKANVSEEQQHVNELIRSGSYFEEARRWYQTLYIGPIAERTFFLIVASLAGLVALAGIISVLSLLPIIERPALLIPNDRLSEVALGLKRMRTHYRPIDQAMQEFFVKQYVFMRESYDAVHYPKDYAFIHAHSDKPTFDAYANSYDTANPESPLVTLGERGQRLVRIHWADVNESSEPKVATVRFSTETIIGDAATIREWTATIGFYYSALAVTPVTDPATGEMRTQTQEPVFKVVNYVLTPASAAP